MIIDKDTQLASILRGERPLLAGLAQYLKKLIEKVCSRVPGLRRCQPDTQFMTRAAMSEKQADEVLKNTFRELDQIVEEQRSRKENAGPPERTKKPGEPVGSACRPTTSRL